MDEVKEILKEVIEEISKKEKITEKEREELFELLRLVKLNEKDDKFSFSFNRLALIGYHLLAFIRRLETNEKLPPVESGLWNEISPEVKKLSIEVLQKYVQRFKKELKELDETEIFLLAVHFEASKIKCVGGKNNA
ncbi:PRD domain protein EF_0829/AHA_3910 [Thermoanaerobacter uzonensis DSM 18761]|uniref:PRD domain protein EF_0829/AHA_3910 n=1 Tax=Thermoanaerobacter uzonensis DSM 18761 TaxID=1123369 RepID=A0A1M5AF38_9THEO|nr:PRD domain-containing protein [Thermoanaerobacter uzonensis]SHF28726.1 PRD domain protein EF_0829/AHA_3910 [Thermoanaerobacter uzonensis DSM 18761]